uniref:NB-ARC domain-containing protein n=1 Tax=Leersia perrieri TaxID=77586 RepID=A0A0D9XTD7_9ORYZ
MPDAIIVGMEIDLGPLITVIKHRDYAGARFHVLSGACEHLAHVRDCVRTRIRVMVGSGLIQEVDIEVAYQKGFSHIATLQELCLLQPAEDGEAVQMQSTMRNFALWLARDLGKNKNKWTIQTKEHWGLAEQILLVGLKIAELPLIPSNQKTLAVLILQHNYLKDGSFSNFPSLLSLKYLDLSFNKFSNIPAEICLQVNLTYLNLSNNRIKMVPVELGSLTKLKHLHLRNNPNLVIPNDMLPKLQNLEVLDVCSFNLLQCSSYEAPINELVHMDKLQSLGSLFIQKLHFKRLTTLPIRSLSIVTYNDEDVHGTQVFSDNSCINPERRTKLFELGIYTRKRTIVLDSLHSVWNLQHVEKAYIHGHFINGIICQEMHPVDVFAKLKRLDIVRCIRLNHISWIMHLPLLEDLLLFTCSSMHRIIGTTEDGVVKTNQNNENSSVNNTFPRLKRMTLIEADALVRICSPIFSFPSLECLQISDCPMLKKLPFLTVPSKLKCIRGENEWWDGLEWEDQDLESSLALYFLGFSTEEVSELYFFSSLQVEWANIVTP